MTLEDFTVIPSKPKEGGRENKIGRLADRQTYRQVLIKLTEEEVYMQPHIAVV